MSINILNEFEIENAIVCGSLLAKVMKKIEASLQIGITTYEIDQISEKTMSELGLHSAFKNYIVPGIGAYPTATCLSINEEIVHGIPSRKRILREGDIISVDIGAEYHGIYTDMAATFAIGKISKEAANLIETTKDALEKGIEQTCAGNSIGDVGHAIEIFATNKGMGVVREYVGHGIGTKPHLPPQIPNYGSPGTGPALKEGMALAIEPMLTLGQPETRVLSDRWTVVTQDKSLAAHFEHTVIIIGGRPRVVTKTE